MKLDKELLKEDLDDLKFVLGRILSLSIFGFIVASIIIYVVSLLLIFFPSVGSCEDVNFCSRVAIIGNIVMILAVIIGFYYRYVKE